MKDIEIPFVRTAFVVLKVSYILGQKPDRLYEHSKELKLLWKH